MRLIIKMLIIVFLAILILSATAIPKIISYVWYGKWNIPNLDNYDNHKKYWESIADLICTIVENEEIEITE